MTTAIVAMLIWGMVVCIIPLFLFFEIYHWVRNKNQISWAYLKGISVSLIIGITVTYLLLRSATGESGLAFLALTPFLIGGFIITGILISSFYRWRKRPLFVRKPKE